MGSLLKCQSVWAFLFAVQAGSVAGDELRNRAAALFGTIDPVAAEEVEAPLARLGRALFWDTRLSADGKTACASCHPTETVGGTSFVRWKPRPLDCAGCHAAAPSSTTAPTSVRR